MDDKTFFVNLLDGGVICNKLNLNLSESDIKDGLRTELLEISNLNVTKNDWKKYLINREKLT